MKSVLPYLAALTLAVACSSAPKDAVAPVEIPCVCGTPMGDLEGCAHADCRDGRINPDNPECVCGALEIPAAKE